MLAKRLQASALALLTLLSLCGLLAAQRGGRGGGAPAKPLQFRELGPVLGGGRVCCVVGIPGKPGIYYVGAAGGGVWKTTNGGFSWTPIFEKYSTESIGAVAVAPSNPDIVWVGTGEANVRNDVIDGHGIFVSTDAGASFHEVDAAEFHNAGQTSKIVINPTDPNEVWVAVLGHAFGPNPNRGVYHTTDGGKTFQKTLFVDNTTGAIDLTMEPKNPKVLVAAMWQTIRYPWALNSGGPGSGIFKSTDGGATWNRITAGLPAGDYGRIAVEFAPSQPSLIYALIEAKDGLFWKSDDAGDHWTAVSHNYQNDARPFYFSRFEVMPNDPSKIYFLSVNMTYSADGGKTSTGTGRTLHADDHSLWIDPADPNRQIEGNDGGVNITYDGGANWIHTANLTLEEIYSVHTDSETPYHICVGLQDNGGWCGPSRAQALPNDWRLEVGGDGQYVVPAPSDSNILYVDSQEGDAERHDFRTGAAASVKPVNTAVTGETQYVYAQKYRFNWTSPIEVDSDDPNTLYIGSSVLWKSVNGGHDYAAISGDLTRNEKDKQQPSGGGVNLDLTGAETSDNILSIALSRLDKQTIWVGTDDGYVQVTHDGGKTWMNAAKNIAGLPVWGRLQQIEVSPFDPNTCYIAYDRHEMDDQKPYVFKTHDGGKTWTSISAGLPGDYSARVIREDPNQRGFLALGTDYGLYISGDDGATWTQVKENFPVVAIYDIKFVKSTRDLIVGTHGRGIYLLDNITPLEQMAKPAVRAEAFALFPTLEAVRYQGGGGGGNGLGDDPFAFPVAPPPNGTVIQYYLKDAVASPQAAAEEAAPAAAAGRGGRGGRGAGVGADGPVTIVISDMAGKRVATLRGSANQGINEAVWSGNYDAPPAVAVAAAGNFPGAAAFGPGGGTGIPRPAGGAAPGGDLGRGVPAAAPAAAGGGGRGGFNMVGGLRALAGTYKVTVTVPGLPPQSQLIKLAEDPRVKTNQLAFEATLRAGQQMMPDVLAMNAMLGHLATLNQQLTAIKDRADQNPDVKQSASDLQTKVAALESEFNPTEVRRDSYGGISKFSAEFQGIYRRVSGGYNEFPRKQDLEDWATDRVRLQGYLDRFNAIEKTDLVAFNQVATAHSVNALAIVGPINLPPKPAILLASSAASPAAAGGKSQP